MKFLNELLEQDIISDPDHPKCKICNGGRVHNDGVKN